MDILHRWGVFDAYAEEITGIKEILAEIARQGKFAPIYDFKMLHDF
jgi:hypothetical protein